MLPKQNRLALRTEFVLLKKQGRFIAGKYLSLLLMTSSETSRFAFVVSKKVAAKATDRNKIKRRLSEAVYGCLPKLRGDIKAVFLVKRTAAGCNFDQIKDEVEKLLAV